MKKQLLVILVFFTFLFCFSQTEKPLKGTVLCDDAPVQGVEVINLKTEKTTITNSIGEFSIGAKAEDILVFISKKYYYKRIFLEKVDIKKNDIKINLTQKPEETKRSCNYKSTI